MPIELYPFKYFDLVRKRWVNARYRCSKEELALRYPQGFEITGPPEIRSGDRDSTFTGNFGASTASAAEEAPRSQGQPETATRPSAGGSGPGTGGREGE